MRKLEILQNLIINFYSRFQQRSSLTGFDSQGMYIFMMIHCVVQDIYIVLSKNAPFSIMGYFKNVFSHETPPPQNKKKKTGYIFAEHYISQKTKHKQETALHSFFPRPLVFKLHQEILELNDICVSWILPKTELEMNFLNLEYNSFDYISFSQ